MPDGFCAEHGTFHAGDDLPVGHEPLEHPHSPNCWKDFFEFHCAVDCPQRAFERAMKDPKK